MGVAVMTDQPDAPPETSNYLLYKGRYIITGGKSGIMLIDKQRAHIRVLFEQFIDQLNNRRGISQQLLFPEIVELNAADALVLEHDDEYGTSSRSYETGNPESAGTFGWCSLQIFRVQT